MAQTPKITLMSSNITTEPNPISGQWIVMIDSDGVIKKKNSDGEIVNLEEDFINLSCITTDDSITPLLVNGTDLLTIPEETAWKFTGTGTVMRANGVQAYFNFEGLIHNLDSGNNIGLTYIKMITSGDSASSNASGQNSASASNTNNGEVLALVKAWPDGEVSLYCNLGFDFDSNTKFLIVRNNSQLYFMGAGEVDTILRWSAKIKIVKINEENIIS